jgi:hypothetical protein
VLQPEAETFVDDNLNVDTAGLTRVINGLKDQALQTALGRLRTYTRTKSPEEQLKVDLGLSAPDTLPYSNR